ncbi:MAG: hypothetical protein M1816_005186 [Peltula sp. TS41687]|nr:MAG: hypothetical protein M1816_005186 [Peltula sp. TS41687]
MFLLSRNTPKTSPTSIRSTRTTTGREEEQQQQWQSVVQQQKSSNHLPTRPIRVQEEQSEHEVLARDLNRPVYALDLRNHGDSPHDPIHDYPSMADDVEFFIQKHGLSSPTLIGHSMGAKTAMTLCLRSPDTIHSLVSVDNAPIDAALSHSFSRYISGMQALQSSPQNIRKQSDALAFLELYEPSLAIRQFLLTNLVRRPSSSSSSSQEPSSREPSQGGSPHGGATAEAESEFRIPLTTLANALNHMADFPYKDPDRHRFEKPALFVRGTESRYVPDEVLSLVGRFFPRFRVVDVQGAGHWVAAERPEEFRRCVVEFLRGVGDGEQG